MRETLIYTNTATAQDGRPLTYEYFITVDDLSIGSTLICESYGAAIRCDDGAYAAVRNITTSALQIEQMLELFQKSLVSPETLYDVVTDLI
jgi:hypothetical protein